MIRPQFPQPVDIPHGSNNTDVEIFATCVFFQTEK